MEPHEAAGANDGVAMDVDETADTQNERQTPDGDQRSPGGDETTPPARPSKQRKKRRKKDVVQAAIDSRPQPRDEEMEMLDAVTQRLKNINLDDPDPDELEELREILSVNPQLCDVLADIAGGLFERLIMVSRSTALGRLALSQRVNHMREELVCSRDSIIDRLVGDEVVASWLFHQQSQQQFVEVTSTATTLETYRLLDQRRGTTQSQLLRAVDAFKRLERKSGRTMVRGTKVPSDRDIEDAIVENI